MSGFGEYLQALKAKKENGKHNDKRELEKIKMAKVDKMLSDRVRMFEVETFCRTEVKSGVPIQYILDTVKYHINTNKEDI